MQLVGPKSLTCVLRLRNQPPSTQIRVCLVQRELESLFDRYDEDCSNTIDYKHLCDHIFEMGEHIAMNSTSRSMIERVSVPADFMLLLWAMFCVLCVYVHSFTTHIGGRCYSFKEDPERRRRSERV